ncbi:unnamed protein product [Dovyalis caffra]|uniref:Uncharacterized protein n=1 Tax=Dovyalis caffra TaxID=77055 RepID=A0AAV1SI26_9ROSI|nr:unnamed protein product [Dovyalis caffra]
MDVSELIESLESLWFFTNVVSSRTSHARNRTQEESPQPMTPILQTSLQNHEDSPKPEFLTPKCPKCGDFAAEIEEHDGGKQTIKIEEVETPKPTKKNEDSPKPEFLTPKCSKCGDFAAEIEEHDADKQINKIEEVETPKPTKKEEKRKRRQRRRRSKRKILGELDLGFDSSNYYKLDYGFRVFEDKETRGYGMFGRQLQHQGKMPPLNDGMAMKEHLKSWAHAVACTVR